MEKKHICCYGEGAYPFLWGGIIFVPLRREHIRSYGEEAYSFQWGGSKFVSRRDYMLIFDKTEGVCPFIAFFVTEFATVFHSLLFWRILFLPPKAPNKNTHPN